MHHPILCLPCPPSPSKVAPVLFAFWYVRLDMLKTAISVYTFATISKVNDQSGTHTRIYAHTHDVRTLRGQ